MKKIFLIVSLACLHFNSHAQGNFGNHSEHMPTLNLYTALKVGAAFSGMNFTSNYNFSQVSQKPGFSVGGLFRFDYIYEVYEWEFGVLYTRRGAKASSNDYYYEPAELDVKYTRDYTLNYLDVPVMLSLTPTPWRKNRFFVGGGLIFSIGISGKLQEEFDSPVFSSPFKEVTDIKWDDTEESILTMMDLLYTGHIGYRFNTRDEIRLSYQQSLFNIDPHDQSIRNNMIMISYVRQSFRDDMRRRPISDRKRQRFARGMAGS